MFVKSMTAYADHRVWQDVYNVPMDGLIIYLKFPVLCSNWDHAIRSRETQPAPHLRA